MSGAGPSIRRIHVEGCLVNGMVAGALAEKGVYSSCPLPAPLEKVVTEGRGLRYSRSVLKEVCMDTRIIILLIAAIVSGCGSGGSDSTPTTSSSVSSAASSVSSTSSIANTHVYWTGSFIEGAEFTTAETRSPQMTLHVSVSGLPATGLYLQRTGSTTGIITSAVFGQPTFSFTPGTAFGQYAVTLKPPAALGSGVFNDTMRFRACFDSACTQVVAESEYTLNFNFIIPATEGVEFMRQMLPLSNGATDVVWSSTNQSLYAVSSKYAAFDLGSAYDPVVRQIDPVSMAAGPSVTLAGDDLERMAVATDGTYLYIGSKSRSLLHRFTLPALTKDLSIPLGNASPYYPNVVSDVEMIPGSPRSFIATLASSSYNLGVFVYDDAVARPNHIAPVQGFEPTRYLVAGETAGTYVSQSYGPSFPKINTLDRIALNANGLSVISSSPIGGELVYGELFRSGVRLFTPNGKILDASTGAEIGTLQLPDTTYVRAFLVDEAHGRLFVWMPVRQREFVLSYDLTTLQLLALAPVYPASQATTPLLGKMVLWGADGVALVDGDKLIVISGAFFSTYRGAPTLSIPSPTT